MARLIVLFGMVLMTLTASASGADILITNDKFQDYLKDAKPGDTFSIYPGTYRLTRSLKIEANGTKEAPITLRPANGGKVIIQADIRGAAIKLSGANWIIEGLEFNGICNNQAHCDHALHIVSTADNTIIRNNRLIDFNSAIKGNGEIINGRQYFPDRVLIENNTIYNNNGRHVSNPVTPIDVVGGRYWVVRGNFIADFYKAGGNKISYAGFLKGNSDNGLFEGNTVICEWRHYGGTRLGLSLGGGGTTQPNYCQGKSCKIEHYKGTIRGNLIMNCPKDVGIYLNNAANTKVENNTIINTAGVDVRFTGSFATFANNVIQGRIKDRDGGRHRDLGNLVEPDLADIYPNAINFDLTPANMDAFRAAVRDIDSKDLCTGETQNDWKGALAYPLACTLKDILNGPVEDEQR